MILMADTSLPFYWFSGVVQCVSYPSVLPVLIRWPSFLLEKQKDRRAFVRKQKVEEILQNTRGICFRKCTPIIILLKSKRRYALGENCALQINQHHQVGIACLQRAAVEQPLTKEQHAGPPQQALTNQGCTKKTNSLCKRDFAYGQNSIRGCSRGCEVSFHFGSGYRVLFFSF